MTDQDQLKLDAISREELNSVLKPLQDVESAVYRLRALWGRNVSVPPERRQASVLREISNELVEAASRLNEAIALPLIRQQAGLQPAKPASVSDLKLLPNEVVELDAELDAATSAAELKAA